MESFTTQQLLGHVKYQPTCLIGNWSEDVEISRATLKDFLSKQSTGSLKSDKYQRKLGRALQEVQLTKIRDDPYVHFGDLLQLLHINTGTVLACDVEDKDPRTAQLNACSATAAADTKEPCARTTLIITKYSPATVSAADRLYDDDVLHYGQKIRLLANPQAQSLELDCAGGPRPLALFSKPISPTDYAKYSRHQLTGFSWNSSSYDSVWQVLTPHSGDRQASEGLEVMAGAPILLVHCATQKPLCIEQQHKVPSDFGLEYELSTHQAVSTGIQSGLEHMKQGRMIRTLPKNQLSPNHWAFITGSTVATLPEPASAQQHRAACQVVLDAVCQQISCKPSVMPVLEKKLVMLEGADGSIVQEELLMILRQSGLDVAQQDVAALAAGFPTSKPHKVDAGSLLQALKA